VCSSDLPLLVLQGPYNVNPDLHLILLQSATLTRVSDHQVLYRITLLRNMPGQAPFLDWAKDDAARLRHALSGMDTRMGERLLDEMFLLHALPSGREWKKVQP
jgi:hypothetical protein